MGALINPRENNYTKKIDRLTVFIDTTFDLLGEFGQGVRFQIGKELIAFLCDFLPNEIIRSRHASLSEQ
jgi:hypothetical protein